MSDRLHHFQDVPFRPTGYVFEVLGWVYFVEAKAEERVSYAAYASIMNHNVVVRDSYNEHHFYHPETNVLRQFHCFDHPHRPYEREEADIIVRMNFLDGLSHEAITGMLRVAEYYSIPKTDVERLYVAYRLDGGP